MNATWPLVIYYDASCPLCMAEMGNLMLRNREANLVFVDVSATPGASPLPGVPVKAPVLVSKLAQLGLLLMLKVSRRDLITTSASTLTVTTVRLILSTLLYRKWPAAKVWQNYWCAPG